MAHGAVEVEAVELRARAVEEPTLVLLFDRFDGMWVVEIDIHRDAGREPEVDPAAVIFLPTGEDGVERKEDVGVDEVAGQCVHACLACSLRSFGEFTP